MYVYAHNVKFATEKDDLKSEKGKILFTTMFLDEFLIKSCSVQLLEVI
jgi:hypothetical protein